MKNELKVGDRVVAKDIMSGVNIDGLVGTVTEVQRSYATVRFDKSNRHFHDGTNCMNKNGVENYHFFVYKKQLRKLNDHWKVVIVPDGDKTVGKLIVDGKVVKEVTTKKHPDDKYDISYAIEVVTERLTEPKYFNGKVVCVNNGCCPDALTIGKIYTFVDGNCKTDTGRVNIADTPVTNVTDLNDRFSTIKFIEVVE